MRHLTRFRRRAKTQVVAIQLSLDMAPLIYQKWGDQQTAKSGDWLVSNAGDIYTVDEQSFAQTYRRVSEGVFEKTADVWACEAVQAGSVLTNEGRTHYQVGDYLVANDPDGADIYAISADKFHQLYVLAESDQS